MDQPGAGSSRHRPARTRYCRWADLSRPAPAEPVHGRVEFLTAKAVRLFARRLAEVGVGLDIGLQLQWKVLLLHHLALDLQVIAVEVDNGELGVAMGVPAGAR